MKSIRQFTAITLFMLTATAAMAQVQPSGTNPTPNPAIESKTAVGTPQTTIVDANGNLKMVKPQDSTETHSPMMPAAPIANPVTPSTQH